MQKLQEDVSQGIFIGTIVEVDKTLFGVSYQPIGTPQITKMLSLSVQEVPFTKRTFKKYNDLKLSQGKKPYFVFNDSLDIKPTYFNFTITDRIGLLKSLNSVDNSTIRQYLMQDSEYALIDEISVIVDEKQRGMLSDAKIIFLFENSFGNLVIKSVSKNIEDVIPVEIEDIFNMQTLTPCWGLNKFRQSEIQSLVRDGSCPKGTKLNSTDLKNENPYLKLR